MAIWDSRFKKSLSKAALNFSSSIELDKRFYYEDIEGSIAHVKMLVKQKIISSIEGNKITSALIEIRKEIEQNKINFKYEDEDIHSVIEERLAAKIGETAKHLHTGRSRNDQIALDERLYLRKEFKTIEGLAIKFQKELLKKAKENKNVIIFGYTHLQRAQPILFAHHLIAYIEMIERDKNRFADSLSRINKSPLGASAFAGSSLPLDRRYSARLLKMKSILINSIDAVSDRDAIIETISNCSILMMHLSRFAEELIIWNSQEFSFASFDDDFATGSSLMPQKKNPDIAELIRAKTGRTFGALMGILTVMKALPLAYNRDMQEDKFHLFNAIDTVKESLSIFIELIKHTLFDENRFSDELTGDFSFATDLVDYLVKKQVPFRKAHNIVGQIIAECISKKIKLKDLSLDEFKSFSTKFDKDIFNLFIPSTSISNKKTEGSTSFKEVEKQIKNWENILSHK